MTEQNPKAADIILASSSPYRRELLARLGIEFQCISPNIDESQQKQEAPRDYVLRLAEAKARAIAQQYHDHIVIGSDQCAVVDGVITGKPGTNQMAKTQLRQASDKQIEFLTGVCVLQQSSNQIQTFLEPFAVKFRALSDTEIERYIKVEQPLDCAGSFKSEGLGIALAKAMVGEDPTALIGLPLIKLSQVLREFNVLIP